MPTGHRICRFCGSIVPESHYIRSLDPGSHRSACFTKAAQLRNAPSNAESDERNSQDLTQRIDFLLGPERFVVALSFGTARNCFRKPKLSSRDHWENSERGLQGREGALSNGSTRAYNVRTKGSHQPRHDARDPLQAP
jgi:hypothetical protein